MLAALAVLAPLYKCGSIVAHLAARSAPAAQAGDARANDSALHQSDTPIAAPTNITGQ
jgi:curli biogenesis system outer membrane secretion channel CsgG